jgi:hypothetical protein
MSLDNSGVNFTYFSSRTQVVTIKNAFQKKKLGFLKKRKRFRNHGMCSWLFRIGKLWNAFQKTESPFFKKKNVLGECGTRSWPVRFGTLSIFFVNAFFLEIGH